MVPHYYYYYYYYFGRAGGACGILVPRPGIEPMPLVVKARSLNYWAAREFLMVPHYFHSFFPLIQPSLFAYPQHQTLEKSSE